MMFFGGRRFWAEPSRQILYKQIFYHLTKFLSTLVETKKRIWAFDWLLHVAYNSSF